MRQLILASLVLLPFAAHAQAQTAFTAQSPAVLTASNTHASVLLPAPAANAATPAPRPIATHEIINAVFDSGNPFPADGAAEGSETTFGSVPLTAVPKLKHWTAIDVPQTELASAPAETAVSLRMVVNRAGQPVNVQVVHSTNPVIDQQAIAAVSQFRFSPATANYVPVESNVVVNVTIQKK